MPPVLLGGYWQGWGLIKLANSLPGSLTNYIGGLNNVSNSMFLFDQSHTNALATADNAAFRRWIAERGAARDWDALFAYRTKAPHAVEMHPTDEHWLPWYPAAGAAGAAPPGLRLHQSLTFGCLGMDTYAFGAAAPALAAALPN